MTPDRSAHHVDADHVEGVVVMEYVLQVNSAVAEQAGRGADDDRCPRLHVTGLSGDRGAAGKGRA